jgi:hypothetical protein
MGSISHACLSHHRKIHRESKTYLQFMLFGLRSLQAMFKLRVDDFNCLRHSVLVSQSRGGDFFLWDFIYSIPKESKQATRARPAPRFPRIAFKNSSKR